MITKWVVAAGARRSGSTLQYQLAREVVVNYGGGFDARFVKFLDFDRYYDQYDGEYDYVIVKSHAHLPSLSKKCANIWNEGRGYGLFIHRNIYDTMVSSARLGKMWEKWWGGSHKQPKGTLFRDMRRIIAESMAWLDTDNVLVTAYDDVLTLDGMAKECRRIADHIGIEVPEHAYMEIAEEYTIDKQMGRMPERGINPESGLYADHIDTTYSGKWRDRLTKEQVDYCEEISKDLRARLGYD